MVIYEVRIEPKSEILEEFRMWLFDYVQDLLMLPGFVDARILTPEAVQANEVVVQLRMKNHDALKSYLREHAEHKRAQMNARFPNGLRIERRVYFADELSRRTPPPRNLIMPDFSEP